MKRSALIKEIHQAIDIVESEQLLKAVYMILNEEIKHKREIIEPFTLEEFYARNEQSQKEIKQGKLVEHKAIRKKYSGK